MRSPTWKRLVLGPSTVANSFMGAALSEASKRLSVECVAPPSTPASRTEEEEEEDMSGLGGQREAAIDLKGMEHCTESLLAAMLLRQ